MTLLHISNQSSISSAVGTISIQPQFGFTSLNEAVNTLVTAVFFFGGLAAFFYLLLGAFKYIIAGGDETKIKGARDTMIHAIVGLILLGMVMVIFQVLASAIPGLEQLITL